MRAGGRLVWIFSEEEKGTGITGNGKGRTDGHVEGKAFRATEIPRKRAVNQKC